MQKIFFYRPTYPIFFSDGYRKQIISFFRPYLSTGELGYDGLNGTRKIGPSYAKSVIYI